MSTLDISTPDAPLATTQPPVNTGWTQYYYLDGERVALRNADGVQYLFGDHLGSTSILADSTGNLIAEQRYTAWGEARFTSGTLATDYQYTGQRSQMDAVGLYYYNARWYDPTLGRFAQADALVPQPGNAQDWDRYAYVRNNPVAYRDPSGHKQECGHDGDTHCGTGIGYATPSEMIEEYFYMRGGVGSGVSYGEQAEYSYDEFSTSGHGKPIISFPGLLNEALVWLRDNTKILECKLFGNKPTGVVQVFVSPVSEYREEILGVRIVNYTSSTIHIVSIDLKMQLADESWKSSTYFPPETLSIYSKAISAYGTKSISINEIFTSPRWYGLSVYIRGFNNTFSDVLVERRNPISR